jgi:phi LC3 family holin
MKTNLNVRIKNPYFWVGIAGVILTATGAAPESLTSWEALRLWLVSVGGNPATLGGAIIAILGVIYDPTTAGLGDSMAALDYVKPKSVQDDLAEVYTDDRRDEADMMEE